MKLLIVGKNSYIGNTFNLMFNHKHEISVIDTFKPLKIEDYEGYDSVIHLAAIVHKKEKKSAAELYEKINTNLAVQSCSLAKMAGVKQFVFMSTMAVYGNEFRIGKKDLIHENTIPNPKTLYGSSKLNAEEQMKNLVSDTFKIFVVRPPMVYGPNCKGNYPKLLKISKKLPFTPNIKNERSALSVDRLCKFLEYGIEHQFDGLFFPQDPFYQITRDVMLEYRKSLGLPIRLTRFFNPALRLASVFLKPVRKAFGTKIYDFGQFNEDVGVRY